MVQPPDCCTQLSRMCLYVVALWFSFTRAKGLSPILFQHDSALEHYTKSLKMSWKGCMEELEWPAQKLHISLVDQKLHISPTDHLWNEVEWVHQAFSSDISVQAHKCSCGWKWHRSPEHFIWKSIPSQTRECCYSSKREISFILMAIFKIWYIEQAHGCGCDV